MKSLESGFGFEGPLGRMTRGKDDLKFAKHVGLAGRLNNEYDKYVAFLNSFDGVQIILSKAEIQKEEERELHILKR